MRKRKNKIETSKLLLYFCDGLATILTLFTFVAVLMLRDSSPLTYLIPAVFGLVTTAHGFYFWKAKCENQIKLGSVTNFTNNEQSPECETEEFVPSDLER